MFGILTKKDNYQNSGKKGKKTHPTCVDLLCVIFPSKHFLERPKQDITNYSV
jgi:hypothetical protein